MEDVIAGQLLVARPGRHVLPADDADALAALQVLGSRVREALVHVGRHAAIPHEVGHTVAEVPEGPV